MPIYSISSREGMMEKKENLDVRNYTFIQCTTKLLPEFQKKFTKI